MALGKAIDVDSGAVMPGVAIDRPGAPRVRFQVLFGSPAARTYRTAWPVPGTTGHLPAGGTDAMGGGDWYGWRLIGANNRELGRNARRFTSYPLARQAVRHLQQHLDLVVRGTYVEPATGRWIWRVDLDDEPIAISGRWYERDHDSRLGMAKFLQLTPDAVLVDGVVTVHDRRGPLASRIIV